MAREHARILVSRRSEPDWQALLTDEQWLYDQLLTQANINNAGVVPLQVRKWARGAADMTTERIEAALSGLADKGFVLFDTDTEEALVRTFMRHDGVVKHRYMLKNALAVAKQTESPRLRHALAAELRRFGNADADAVAAELEATPDRTPPEPHSNGIPTASGSQSIAHGEGEGVVTLVPPGSTNVDGSSRRPRSQAKRSDTTRGTRIPEDFAVTAEMVAWAREHTPDVDGRTTTAEFIDFWRGRPGRDGYKLDWPATWRNAMRREQKRINERRPARASPNGMSPTDANIAAFASRHMSSPNLIGLPGGAS